MSRAPCAVCDGTNTTTRLCPACRADPANVDWRDGDELPTDALDALPASVLAEMWDTRPSRATDLQQRVLRLLVRDDVPMPRRVQVRSQGARQYVTRMVPRRLTLREVARAAGCDHAYVVRLLRIAAS